MSAEASRPRQSEPVTDKYGLKSSIAAVREILQKNAAAIAESDVVDELSKQKQASYQEKLHLQEELQNQRALLKDLSSKTEHAKAEALREKSMRLILEEAYSKLEDHRKEILSQLDTTKSSQAGMEEKIVRLHEDLDKQNTEFEKERAKWEELMKAMREQDEASKREIGRLDARLAASQQEVKDTASTIEDLQKQVEFAESRHTETVHGYKDIIDKLNSRIEKGRFETIEDLQKRLEEAESNYETTAKELQSTREDLLSFRQFSDKRQETVLSQKAGEKVYEELESAEASLKEAERELESNKETVATLEKEDNDDYKKKDKDDSDKTGEEKDNDVSKKKDKDDNSDKKDNDDSDKKDKDDNSDKKDNDDSDQTPEERAAAAKSQRTVELAKAKLNVKKCTLKLRQTLKKLDGLYKRRLELVKSEVSGTKEDLNTVMARLRSVGADATKAQSDYANFQSRKAQMLQDKDASNKKRAAADDKGEESTTADKRQKQS
ncbi:unnamed protein product [Cylindrotheca closterium]|uniref:Uncharacterized protein n=1 Tax=Cylindrotheca closterium TaxID=2856 RepID=A0AAD2CAT4_9STRA|nr:unnamed protein product [Cylindrotheca closterium]